MSLVKKERVLIVVKTYPNLSRTYKEIVCTAGFREDGSWIRLYPVPFRRLDKYKQYKKYQWISLEVKKNTRDFRPESFKPTNINNMILEQTISTKDHWKQRKFILSKAKIYTNMDTLNKEAHGSKKISLAVFKPKKILDFKIEDDDSDWDSKKLEEIKQEDQQLNFFSNNDQIFKPVSKLPFKFSYVFLDDNDNKSTRMIEDWEIGALYWNMIKKYSKNQACEKVKEKYFPSNLKDNKDVYFYLGTTKAHHYSPNPFIIIGVVFIPKNEQFSLLPDSL